MTINWGKVVKGLVTVAGIGVSLASSYFSDKELDAKVDKKIAEALAEQAGKDA